MTSSGNRMSWFLLTLLFCCLFLLSAVWLRIEKAFVWVGLGLQIMGILTVAIGIQETRNKFRKTGLRAEMHATTAMSATLGKLEASFPLNMSAEARVKDLEATLAAIIQRVGHVEKAVETETRRRVDALRNADDLRERGDQELRSLLKETATGGLDLSRAGVLFLLFGLVMSTIPQDLVRLIDWVINRL